MNLKPGDSLYFGAHSALGFLIERCETVDGACYWKYALRSPTRNKRTLFLISIREERESKFVKAIQSGQLIHYEAR